MISVQNRLRRSNGNKFLLLLLLVAVFSSCGIFSNERTYKKPKTTVKHKKTEKKDPVKTDTVRWEDDPVIQVPDLKEVDLYKKYNSEFKETYRVALILPLKTYTNFDDLTEMRSDLSYRFINYYGGILLALEDLSKKDINIELEVINSSMKSNDDRGMINKLNKLDLDLIIGPYERGLLKEVAKFGKRQEIPVVSPWQSSTRIARDNPYYIQLKPDVKTYYKTIVDHLDNHFIPEQVYLIGREKYRTEQSRLNYLQDLHFAGYEKKYMPKAYKVFNVEEDSLSIGETAFDTLFQDQLYTEIAVVLPNWSFRDEQFIYSCLRKLNAEKQMTRVVVYGMPLIWDSDKIGFNLYKHLNMRVASDAYINDQKSVVKDFKEDYYDRYRTLPDDAAFKGYDMMQFIIRNLVRHGTKFQYFMSESVYEHLQTSFSMTPKVLDENVSDEDLEHIDFFENTHIEVLEFRYNNFEKAE